MKIETYSLITKTLIYEGDRKRIIHSLFSSKQKTFSFPIEIFDDSYIGRKDFCICNSPSVSEKELNDSNYSVFSFTPSIDGFIKSLTKEAFGYAFDANKIYKNIEKESLKDLEPLLAEISKLINLDHFVTSTFLKTNITGIKLNLKQIKFKLNYLLDDCYQNKLLDEYCKLISHFIDCYSLIKYLGSGRKIEKSGKMNFCSIYAVVSDNNKINLSFVFSKIFDSICNISCFSEKGILIDAKQITSLLDIPCKLFDDVSYLNSFFFEKNKNYIKTTKGEVSKACFLKYFLDDEELKNIIANKDFGENVRKYCESLSLYAAHYTNLSSKESVEYLENSNKEDRTLYKNYAEMNTIVNYYINRERHLYSVMPQLTDIKKSYSFTKNKNQIYNHTYTYYAKCCFLTICSCLIFASISSSCFGDIENEFEKLGNIKKHYKRHKETLNFLHKTNSVLSIHSFGTYSPKNNMRHLAQIVGEASGCNRQEEILKNNAENFWTQSNVYNGMVFPMFQIFLSAASILSAFIIGFYSLKLCRDLADDIIGKSGEQKADVIFRYILFTNGYWLIFAIVLALGIFGTILAIKLIRKKRD